MSTWIFVGPLAGVLVGWVGARMVGSRTLPGCACCAGCGCGANCGCTKDFKCNAACLCGQR
jgi:hypothetical protein